MHTHSRPLRLLILCAVMAQASTVALSAQAIDQPAFDRWIEGLMQQWHVPGVAVAAVKDGEVVLSKGYGYRDVEGRRPVTPASLFAIGSNSKSFTVVLMGQLVDEGKLDWDAPVRDYLPEFALWDEYAARNMRVKDLVSHVSGLPRHDLLWYGRSLSRPEIFQRLKYLEPTTSFRGRWQYQNLMFLTAGYLVERVTGRSWDDLIRERIFEPLGMIRSNTSVKDMPGSGDFSYPYLYDADDDELRRVPFREIDNVGPAGSINSSIEEMVNYVRARIGLGEWNGARLLERETDLLTQQPHSVVAPMTDPEYGPLTYGLGLMVSSYRGHKQVTHGGGIDGFISAMAWLPNDDIGVVVLSNMSGAANPLPGIVRDRVFDELLGYDPIDWNARRGEQIETARSAEEARVAEIEAKRMTDTSPSRALADYAGAYGHPGYGDVMISERGGVLQATFDLFEDALEHYHLDVFWIPREADSPMAGTRLKFELDKDGEIVALTIPLEEALPDIRFEKREGDSG